MRWVGEIKSVTVKCPEDQECYLRGEVGEVIKVERIELLALVFKFHTCKIAGATNGRGCWGIGV